VREQDFQMPVLLDTRGDVAQVYRVGGLPVTYFVDREGIVRSVNFGLVTEDELVKRLARIGVDVPPGIFGRRN
jgi:cytochrome c biogenesis protein CcmG/thiol:disulfide interchange protein DsbE